MILINDQWEQVKNDEDIIRIISENIGDEFAKEARKIFDQYQEICEENYSLENELKNKTETIEKLRELFVEVLGIASNLLKNNEEKEYINEFDDIAEGDV